MINVPENFSEQNHKETSPTSPVHVHQEPIESPGNTTTAVGMTFNQAMLVLLRGGVVYRASWPEPAVVVKFIEEQLVIYGVPDDLWHPLIVRVDDVIGTDWQEV